MEFLVADDVPVASVLARASAQDGRYPRPQLVRPDWADLGGRWGFRDDPDDVGRRDGWHRGWADAEGGAIIVPFPPESPASGIGDAGFHPVVWYQRVIEPGERAAAGSGERLLLHFGAVDYRADVWIGGIHVRSHEGGHVPFSIDITDAAGGDSALVVVRVEDDPADVAQPRGKQDWELDQHVIWYDRTTGIWQPVWLESVAATSVAHLAWTVDLIGAAVRADIELTVAPRLPGAVLRVELELDGVALGSAQVPVEGPRVSLSVPVARLRNGQDLEPLLWSPAHPHLVDARVSVSEDGRTTDAVASYLGIRSVSVEGADVVLNGRPTPMRGVLEQGFWPRSHLAAPSAEALREEVELILALGFTFARIHQKLEDPRFLYWADRLGLMVWEEMPSAYEFSPVAIARTTAEWTAAVRRDSSHPSIVAWVPVNESWGVQQIASVPAQRAYARGLADLTRALDPSRPVISNDGWEHVGSDLLTIHDYEPDGAIMAERYADEGAVAALVEGRGPAGRILWLDRGTPVPACVLLTEFGGVKFAAADAGGAWGYSTAVDADDFESRLRALIGAVRSARGLAGFCYTQLTDTGLEVNGLLTEDRLPKLPIETLRAIIAG
ncbi:glycoside hydrolase family 2 TIM barrel-domain containing protein [Galbitalea sp. SE-J8]|uniref:glycoside hydrolase family 2 protein n=1 Tax=Galbitalea sp. SE-J8 TaxID=3054952 RepID=UPI00259C74F3|nr:glycoside hydrolase family 2 TIM barrel-domain containing protein [Galbitalea sp. SE-J8]MDM4762146.1 glycoside hydrolase family 2 TIM barrel-domain containing protein [Galbitalea sp. SE-J8]